MTGLVSSSRLLNRARVDYMGNQRMVHGQENDSIDGMWMLAPLLEEMWEVDLEERWRGVEPARWHVESVRKYGDGRDEISRKGGWVSTVEIRKLISLEWAKQPEVSILFQRVTNNWPQHILETLRSPEVIGQA